MGDRLLEGPANGGTDVVLGAPASGRCDSAPPTTGLELFRRTRGTSALINPACCARFRRQRSTPSEEPHVDGDARRVFGGGKSLYPTQVRAVRLLILLETFSHAGQAFSLMTYRIFRTIR